MPPAKMSYEFNYFRFSSDDFLTVVIYNLLGIYNYKDYKLQVVDTG